jgi:hypothetical protein
MHATGQTDLKELLKKLKPKHIPGDYVFCVVQDLRGINIDDVVMVFKENEGTTIILKKTLADQLEFSYSFVAAWITLTVHPSLEAVGLTATFSKALAVKGISCNVVAAYYHDHIFVSKKDSEKAMDILTKLSG